MNRCAITISERQPEPLKGKSEAVYGSTGIILGRKIRLKQYCRYCSHCIAQEKGIGYCEQKNEVVKKTSIRNSCQDFDFFEIDAFYFERSDNQNKTRYKPREKKKEECNDPLSLFRN